MAYFTSLSIGADTSIESFDALSQYFENIKKHSSYMLREKLYNAKENGIKKSHIKFDIAIAALHKIQASTLDFYSGELKAIRDEIEETLVIISQYQMFDLDLDDLKNYALLIEISVDKLNQLLEGIRQQTADEINELKKSTISDEVETIKFKFQDNIDQLLKSFTWKEFENHMISTEDEAEFERFVKLLSSLNEIKVKGSLLDDLAHINLLSKISIYVREQIAIDFTRLFLLIPMLQAIVHVLGSQVDVLQTSNSVEIQKEDIFNDLEYLVNTGQISWLAVLYEHIDQDLLGHKKHLVPLKFVQQVYSLTRDPRELFLWTMNYVSQRMADEEIIKLSYKVANLSGILLTCTVPLKNRGVDYLVERIQDIEDISYKDAITDLSEIYNISNISGDHMKKALKSKISKLKDLLCEIIYFEDIAEDVIVMLEFDPTIDDVVSIENLQVIIDKY